MDSKKSLIALALVALVGLVGRTFAYFTSSTTLNNEFVTGTLITLSELKELGCTINDDYSWTSGLTCANSDNADWLLNGQVW